MLVLDSSVWIEYFSATCRHAEFVGAVEDGAKLLVPSITIYEVFKRMLAQKNQQDALDAVGIMISSEVLSLDNDVAISAAKFSHQYRLHMADSIIYVTAQKHHAILWTMDADLKKLPQVRYFGNN